MSFYLYNINLNIRPQWYRYCKQNVYFNQVKNVALIFANLNIFIINFILEINPKTPKPCKEGGQLK